ncbi:DNA mismatch repair protein Mlh1-like [Ornithodoros turicata]|uniref:DNA mismatch repair protein Mlh1-like n=1 Tax=Ornithodoros turicata TaxID=34597 RepID=UPI003139BDE9
MATPAPIRRLDESVTNRIAAGEVIQRPANALKEMLENSIDAKATSIEVTVKAGGLKKLVIKDNGCGIRKEDLDIVCERFTTSKLVKFEDLTTISTYGFRGEALASISYVAHVTITTMTEGAQGAYQVTYTNGKPTGPPKLCAGTRGTIICVEDLFYNVPTRRNAFNKPNDEHKRVLDMFTRYAVHNAGIQFVLTKDGERTPDVRTSSEWDTLQNISATYGTNVRRELLPVECKNEDLKFSLKGYVSNANCSYKKCTMLLFINHRLVESAALRKAVESIYATYLPKNAHPWMYFSLEIHPNNIDVNVHPTKQEVHFLHEDLILDAIQKAVDATLLSCNTSRTYLTQSRLPQLSVGKSAEQVTRKSDGGRVSERHLVRTDSQAQKLDGFVGTPKRSSQESGAAEARRNLRLKSVSELAEAVERRSSAGLRELLQNHTFVGVVNQKFALVQHLTNLYIINTRQISRELFYQLALKDFGNFAAMRLSEPAPIHDLVMLALDSEESGWTEEDGPKEDLANHVVDFLKTKAEMLNDYFSLEIDESGQILTLPVILDNHTPPMEGLPMYLLRLATEVDWETERECFDTFCRETADFYAMPHYKDRTAEESPEKSWKWVTEHVLYPATKAHLRLPSEFTDNSCILQIANLSDLYKVFERC